MLFITALAGMLLAGCMPKVFFKSAWQSTPVNVDGEAREWNKPLMFTDNDAKVNYSITNDANNLYICFETSYEANITGITQRGLQIWFDTTGKKNHQMGLLCPIPQNNAYGSNNNQRQRSGGNGGGNSQDYYYGNQQQQQNPALYPDTAKENSARRKFIATIKTMHVSGFKTVPSGIISTSDSSGINLGASWDSPNILLYEVAIPLKAFFRYPLTQADTNKTIGVSFNFTEVPKNANNQRGGGMRGGMGMGMGFGGFGMSFPISGGGGGSYAASPQPVAVWIPIHLSKQ